jgi:hypothetical protein
VIEVVRYQGKPIYRAYGQLWPSVPVIKDDRAVKLAIELEAFRVGLSVEQGGKGKYLHFRTICEWQFPSFDWHRWAVRTAKALCSYKYVGLAGSGKSGKSDIMALWGLVSWEADPKNTKVFVLSTNKTDARGRIWGHFCNRFNEMDKGGIEGFKNVGRDCIITFKDPKRGKGDASSISLVAAGDADRDNAVERLQGQNNENIIILADEFQDCSFSVFDAACNLKLNPNFQFVCSGNAASQLDPHGQFCTPKIGWDSVNADMREWETLLPDGEEGICLRFDGRDSPNYDEFDRTGENKYPYLIRVESVEHAETHWGKKDSKYWRQIRGYWPPGGLDAGIIYPVADLIKHNAMSSKIVWQGVPVDIMGADPSYTNGGDRFICYHLQYGVANRGTAEAPHLIPTIHFKEWVELKLDDSTPNSSRDYNMVRKMRDQAEEWGCEPENCAVDGSSANPIRGIIAREWSDKVLILNFGGSPSDLPYKKDDPRPCKEVFDRKVSELCYIGREFLLNNQLSGIGVEHAKELSMRRYEEVGRKTRVETKSELKERTKGISPDISDAAWCGLELLRQRHKLLPGAKFTPENSWVSLFGPAKTRVDKPPTYTFKSLQTMQRSAPRETNFGSLDSLNSMLRK